MDQLRIRVLKSINLYNYTQRHIRSTFGCLFAMLKYGMHWRKVVLEPCAREVLTVFAVIDCM